MFIGVYLKKTINKMLTQTQFANIGLPTEYPRFEALYNPLLEVIGMFDINTPLRLAHFLAQLKHESDNFRTLEEYASGEAYEGRADLGNIVRGDGRRFKGRGGIQLTGRANYRRFTAWAKEKLPTTAPDFLENPKLVATPYWGMVASGWFWQEKGLNSLADKDNIGAITKRINGGYNGYEQRQKNLAICKRVLGLSK